MKTKTLLRATLPIWAVLVLIAVVVLHTPQLAAASSQHAQLFLATAQATLYAPTSVNATEAPEPKAPPGTEALAAYVLAAMNEWTKGRDATSVTHKAEIARDIAIVAMGEPRAWDGSDGSSEALVLASIAFHEARFRDYVEQCNDAAWVKTKEARALLLLGDCDGALSGYPQAVGLWQVHYECGAIILYVDGAWQNACSPSTMQPHWTITKAAAIESRRDQARVALAMARQSIQRCGGTLNCYVGGEGPSRVRMASQRLDLALTWARMHPFSR